MVTKENVKRFDFKKKPHKPYWLMYVAKYFISFPDLKKRGAITKLSFATEEIYKSAYEKANFAKRTR